MLFFFSSVGLPHWNHRVQSEFQEFVQSLEKCIAIFDSLTLPEQHQTDCVRSFVQSFASSRCMKSQKFHGLADVEKGTGESSNSTFQKLLGLAVVLDSTQRNETDKTLDENWILERSK